MLKRLFFAGFIGLVPCAALAADADVVITVTPQDAFQLAQVLEQYERGCLLWQNTQSCASVVVAWEAKLQAAVDKARSPKAEPPVSSPDGK